MDMNFFVLLVMTFTITYANSEKEVKQAEYMTGLDKVPPVPDEDENNATLLGIDSNKNGIRDDVEIYIHKNFKGDDKYYERMLAFQYAWRLQYKLKFSRKDLELPMDHKKILSEHSNCSSYIKNIHFKTYERYYKYINSIDKIDSLQLNNKVRIRAISLFDSKISGSSFVIKKTKSDCKFKLLN
jgi:hypothetical protein